jgi:hypothetical protein
MLKPSLMQPTLQELDYHPQSAIIPKRNNFVE